MYSSLWICVGLMVLLASCAAQQSPPQTQYPPVDKLPQRAELPDPFRFEDGSRVKTPQDWPRRREELVKLILYYEYGRVPPPPGNVKGTVVSETQSVFLGATVKTILLEMGPADHKITSRVELTIPNGPGPWPVIIRGDLCWGRVDGDILADASRRGYAVADFDRTDFAPDSRDRSKGVYPVYPDYDCAAPAAWAWGFARVVDYLYDQPWVDRQKIIVTGHSRGGKGSQLAGALDTRVALTNPNDSGCGGAGCYRLQAPKSEDIVAITKNFPFWFSTRFPSFIGHIDQLPFDQHSVKALVAPRAYLSTEALGDLWANPQGTQQSHLAAKEVWDFLGAPDRTAIYFREGKHEHTRADWNILMDFADKVLKGKPVETKFNNYAFPTEPKPYSWTKP
ncbi:MAG: hypothetical protein ACHRHE_04790 [Tepidisphaerales bacterium]